MKNKLPKTLLKISLVTLLLSGMTSCNDSNDAKDVAEDQNKEKFDDKDSEKDAQFLVDAAELNYAEIELGQLAQDKAYNPEVKKLGKMMVEEHTKALADVKKIAASKSVSLPETGSKESRDRCDKMSKKDGKDFDKAYCDKMVDDHKDALKDFEDAAGDRKDDDIKAFAAGMLPALRTHLDHSIACQNKCEGKSDTAVVVKNENAMKGATDNDDKQDHDSKGDKNDQSAKDTKKTTKKDW